MDSTTKISKIKRQDVLCLSRPEAYVTVSVADVCWEAFFKMFALFFSVSFVLPFSHSLSLCRDTNNSC